MPCYSPVTAWRDAKRQIAFKPIPDSSQMQLPCGRCIGCRLERSRQWAQRLVDEKRFHDQSSFLTLTYSDDFLPPGGTLVLRDWQLFLKRLRERVSPLRIRFFHAGEYGEKRRRPHYHAILFGLDFYSGRYDVRVSDRGDETWSHDLVDECWERKGLCRIGEVSFESCAYVARYVTKKVTGPRAEDHYWSYDQATGECFDLRPEYATMSRRPGIGCEHALKYLSEIYSRDSVISRGREAKPPRYYDSVLAKVDSSKYEQIKEDRESALRGSPDRTADRLRVREAVKIAQLGTFLKRNYEIG